MRSSDWSSDVCSPDLAPLTGANEQKRRREPPPRDQTRARRTAPRVDRRPPARRGRRQSAGLARLDDPLRQYRRPQGAGPCSARSALLRPARDADGVGARRRSEEHTSELQSLMRISYAVFCLKKKNKTKTNN